MANKNWARWTLFSLDSHDIIEGQYPIPEAVMNLGSNWEEAWSLGRNEPIAQWLHGDLETWNFEAVFRAENGFDSIQRDIDFMKESVRKDDSLGRPPLFEWSWGTHHLTCYIAELGGAKWQMRPINGPREVRFPIQLRKYTQFDIPATDPNKPPGDTLYRPARTGESYEMVAAIRYARPEWGDLLRRRHPSLPYPVASATLALPEPETLLDEDTEPYSPPLQRTAESLDARQAMSELRGKSKVSHVL